MKYFLILVLGFTLSSVGIAQDEQVNWLSWEVAMEMHQNNPKKLYIDLYTDWCGWCKHMDNSTFKDPSLVSTLNEHFYPIKFNAEQKETIQFNGKEFIFIDNGFKGYHELALSLANGELGYPNFIILDEEYSRVLISPGFKEADAVQDELAFALDEAYKRMSFEDYQKARKQQLTQQKKKNKK